MDWIPVVLALGVLGVVGLIFGILLEVADKKLAVEVDPRISKVGEALGGANCGACGYAGCAALAEAIVSGEAKPNACPAANMAAISEALGITVEEGEKMVARVICQGHNGVAKERYKYDGYTSCATAASMAGGPKECAYACIGLGDCMRVCSFGAISMNNGIASIDPNVCVACGNCEKACPRSAIRIIPAETKVLVLCRNKDIGRVARAMITRYGMSDDFGMVALETVNNQYLGGDTSLACSAETAAKIDRDVVAMIGDAYKKAEAIIKENRTAMDALAAYLLEKETITGEEFMDILGKQEQNA